MATSHQEEHGWILHRPEIRTRPAQPHTPAAGGLSGMRASCTAAAMRGRMSHRHPHVGGPTHWSLFFFTPGLPPPPLSYRRCCDGVNEREEREGERQKWKGENYRGRKKEEKTQIHLLCFDWWSQHTFCSGG